LRTAIFEGALLGFSLFGKTSFSKIMISQKKQQKKMKSLITIRKLRQKNY